MKKHYEIFISFTTANGLRPIAESLLNALYDETGNYDSIFYDKISIGMEPIDSEKDVKDLIQKLDDAISENTLVVFLDRLVKFRKIDFNAVSGIYTNTNIFFDRFISDLPGEHDISKWQHLEHDLAYKLAYMLHLLEKERLPKKPMGLITFKNKTAERLLSPLAVQYNRYNIDTINSYQYQTIEESAKIILYRLFALYSPPNSGGSSGSLGIGYHSSIEKKLNIFDINNFNIKNLLS
jgi:hypothetical protein